MAAFQTLLGLGTGRTPTPYGRIRGAMDLSKLLNNRYPQHLVSC